MLKLIKFQIAFLNKEWEGEFHCTLIISNPFHHFCSFNISTIRIVAIEQCNNSDTLPPMQIHDNITPPPPTDTHHFSYS